MNSFLVVFVDGISVQRYKISKQNGRLVSNFPKNEKCHLALKDERYVS